MKATLFLMTEKGYNVLKTIVENDLITTIDLVIINKDNAVANDFSTEIKELADKNNIACKLANQVSVIDSDYSIAVSWRWLIKQSQSKLIVLHDSYLPRYRGFAPLVNALINGEKEIGVTALFASDEYDKGAIISQDKIKISYPIKIQQAIEKVSQIYNNLVLDVLHKIKNNEAIEASPQSEAEASYSLWRDEDDYYIDWNQSSEAIARFVDALGFPYTGAKTKIENRVVVIHSVALHDDVKIENRQAGKIIFLKNEKPVVVCQSGLLVIDDAVYQDSNESIFPLKKFRIKFN